MVRNHKTTYICIFMLPLCNSAFWGWKQWFIGLLLIICKDWSLCNSPQDCIYKKSILYLITSRFFRRRLQWELLLVCALVLCYNDGSLFLMVSKNDVAECSKHICFVLRGIDTSHIKSICISTCNLWLPAFYCCFIMRAILLQSNNCVAAFHHFVGIDHVPQWTIWYIVILVDILYFTLEVLWYFVTTCQTSRIFSMKTHSQLWISNCLWIHEVWITVSTDGAELYGAGVYQASW